MAEQLQVETRLSFLIFLRASVSVVKFSYHPITCDNPITRFTNEFVTMTRLSFNISPWPYVKFMSVDIAQCGASGCI
jgi:hypothetical protein